MLEFSVDGIDKKKVRQHGDEVNVKTPVASENIVPSLLVNNPKYESGSNCCDL